nr:hypothetical protein [Tanacetum cinerariifolium]
MATTIEQQTALDESLVPSSQRLRIGRSNFRLPSDIQSKEATLQVVYDVLRNSPLFRAFQVVSRHQATQQYGAILPIELTIAAIRNRSLPSRDGIEFIGTTFEMMLCFQLLRQETHISQKSGSGTGEGTGSKPGVPNVPSDDSEEELSWKSSDDEEEETAKDDEENKETGKDGDEVRKSGGESEEEKETSEEEEGSFDPIPRTP